MLLGPFECTHPLDLVPQKGNGTLGLADTPTNIEGAKSKLISKLTQEKFIGLNLAEEEILSLSILVKMHCVGWFNRE